MRSNPGIMGLNERRFLMEQKKFKLGFKIGLLPKLLIAIVLGIVIGQFCPVWFCKLIVTASTIFSTFLKFVIPLMIVAYVTMGIADLKVEQDSFW